MIRLLQRLCPHRFGWTYVPSGLRRWCRVCGCEQASEATYADDGSIGALTWRPLHATELGFVEIERQARAFMETLETGLKDDDDGA